MASAAAREEKHFSVPVHDTPAESLIAKPLATLEVAANAVKEANPKKDEGHCGRIFPEHQLGLRKQILKFRNPLVGILLKPQFVSLGSLLTPLRNFCRR